MRFGQKRQGGSMNVQGGVHGLGDYLSVQERLEGQIGFRKVMEGPERWKDQEGYKRF